MDFDFIYDRTTKSYSVICDNEFLALSRFINSELASDQDIQQFLTWLEQESVKQHTYTEWHVELDQEEVFITFNQLKENEAELSELEDDQSTLDWELSCHCGKQDLIKLLTAYLRFRS